MTRVLVVAPHPDDEVIGCGGSIRKRASAGEEITVVTLVERGRSLFDTDVTDAELRAEVDAAHRTLGVQHSVDLGAPERGLAQSRELLLALVRVVRDTAPTVVYVPHENESDLEHQLANRIALEALWMATSQFFADQGTPAPDPELVLAYEVWSPMSRFQYVETIDETLEDKVAAMRCYASQLHHLAWDEAIRGLAAYRGASTGRHYAEVFSVLHLAPPAT